MQLSTIKPLAALIAIASIGSSIELQANELETMIVTAERKESNLQQTPIAVSAFGSEDLQRLQITEVNDIDVNVPGMAINPNVASNTAMSVVLRGSSEPNAAFLFSEPGVGLYMNGFYRRLSAGNVELSDIERIEVSRGPQGTLFGRNTLAGAINIVTKKPSQELSGSLSASYDTFDTSYVKANISGGINDNLAVSVAALYRDRAEGPFTNQFNGEDVGQKTFKGLQGNLLWSFGNDAELFVSAYSTSDEGDGSYGSALDITTGDFIYSATDVYGAATVNGGILPFSDADQSGVDATLTAPLSDSLTLKYLVSYNETESGWGVDFTSGAVATGCEPNCIPAFFRMSNGDQEQSSHELQLLGANESLDWIVGLYYFEEETIQTIQDEFFGFQPAAANYKLDSESAAIFGQVSYALNESISLIAGGRYTDDSKNFIGNIGGANFSTAPEWDEFTGKLGVDFQASDDTLLYLSWNQGFKSGTFNAFANASVIETPLEPEKVDSLEAGIKTTLLDNSLRINAALFSASYEELVVGGVAEGEGLFTRNGGEAEVRGLELEATWAATDALRTFFTLNYLFDFQWDDTSGSVSTRVGDDLPATRELQWTAGATYTLAVGDLGNIDFNIRAQYDDEFYSIANHQNNPVEQVEDRTFFNIGVMFTSADEKHQVWLNGDNITDEENYFRVANFTFLPTNTAYLTPYDPVSYELGYKYSF